LISSQGKHPSSGNTSIHVHKLGKRYDLRLWIENGTEIEKSKMIGVS
jgi:hypothetical protein